MKTLVISLGGSLIVPSSIDVSYLRQFASFLSDLIKKNKVVVVTGGGEVARRYIHALEEFHLHEDFRSWIGIKSTKLNALLLMSLFGYLEEVPDSVKEVKRLLKKRNLVICGSLGFQEKTTSDGSAALLAEALKADVFLNLTNVDGLFDKDPRKKGAKLLERLSFSEFHAFVSHQTFKPGQHFVLDKNAAYRLCRARVPLVILHGRKLSHVKSFLEGRSFKGSLIS